MKVPVTDPPLVVMTIFLVPGRRVGIVQVNDVLELTVTPTVEPPIVTVVSPTMKFVPVTVTAVPAMPVVGETLAKVGTP